MSDNASQLIHVQYNYSYHWQQETMLVEDSLTHYSYICALWPEIKLNSNPVMGQ